MVACVFHVVQTPGDPPCLNWLVSIRELCSSRVLALGITDGLRIACRAELAGLAIARTGVPVAGKPRPEGEEVGAVDVAKPTPQPLARWRLADGRRRLAVGPQLHARSPATTGATIIRLHPRKGTGSGRPRE